MSVTCVHVLSACVCCMGTTCILGALEGKQRAWDPLELELWAVVSHHMRAGKQTRSSVRAMSPVNYCAISRAPIFISPPRVQIMNSNNTVARVWSRYTNRLHLLQRTVPASSHRLAVSETGKNLTPPALFLLQTPVWSSPPSQKKLGECSWEKQTPYPPGIPLEIHRVGEGGTTHLPSQILKISLDLFILLYVYECFCLLLCMCIMHTAGPPETRVVGSLDPPCRSWEQNPDPLEEQQAPVSTAPSLQPCSSIF